MSATSNSIAATILQDVKEIGGEVWDSASMEEKTLAGATLADAAEIHLENLLGADVSEDLLDLAAQFAVMRRELAVIVVKALQKRLAGALVGLGTILLGTAMKEVVALVPGLAALLPPKA